jgi:biopolymer transport protein ExbB
MIIVISDKGQGRTVPALQLLQPETPAMWSIMERGGYVMYPLLATSIVALAVVIERIIFWVILSARTKRDNVDEVLDLARDVPGKAEEAARAKPLSPIMRVLAAGLEHRTSGYRQVLEMSADSEIIYLRRGLMILDTIITLAPLLGILGTVTGIIHSFELLGNTNIEDPRGVSTGIAEALITTAAGLIIAIPALIPFNYFTSRVERYGHMMEQACTRLEIALGRWEKAQGIGTDGSKELEE